MFKAQGLWFRGIRGLRKFRGPGLAGWRCQRFSVVTDLYAPHW